VGLHGGENETRKIKTSDWYSPVSRFSRFFIPDKPNHQENTRSEEHEKTHPKYNIKKRTTSISIIEQLENLQARLSSVLSVATFIGNRSERLLSFVFLLAPSVDVLAASENGLVPPTPCPLLHCPSPDDLVHLV
jgi:hypothetical protein